MRNVDQLFSGTIWQSGPRLNVFSQVVRVRIDRQQVDIDGQNKVGGDGKVALPSRNVKLSVILELQEHREFGRGMRSEIKSDSRLNDLGFPRGLHGRVQD